MIQVTTTDIKQIQLSDDEGTFATLSYDPNQTEPLYCQDCYEDMAKDVLDVLDGLDIRDVIATLKLAIGLVEEVGNNVAATTYRDTQEGYQEATAPMEQATDTPKAAPSEDFLNQLAANLGVDRANIRVFNMSDPTDIAKLLDL